ncbi:MAG TPA: hypothetical protein DEV93_05580 [Chloroflexi bacterium]|nr:hypothetical protein [Chloroflexota bacterium]
MSTEVRRPFINRNPWLLPVFLVVLIAIIAAAVLVARSRSTSSSATATPTAPPKVVTATQAALTPTPGGPPTPTLVSTSGGATPLPRATPVDTVPGLTLGEITRPASEVAALQAGADRGDPRYTYHLDPTKTVEVDLEAYGFASGQYVITKPSPSVTVTPTPQKSPGGRPVINYLISYSGRTYSVAVAQVVKAGPKGIWVIVTILPS